ncbi:XRE family transcriptional regulator [Streptomyces sp. NPDC093589]|uniref:MmyB family transcriptional regulator n=1 Tax=Streptomyces sp. NPDC093589 TaxID=3366043 RepID=UPI00381D6186
MDTTALRSLLEARRAQIDPKSVYGLDLAQHPGRPAPGLGLGQHHVDKMAGYGPGTYNRLINGRINDPKPDLLEAYGRALRVTEQEWHAMYRFARSETPPFALHPKSGLEVPGMWQDAVASIGHIAYVADCSYNLLATSPAFDGIFRDLERPTNMMRWMLLAPDARRILADWPTAWAPYVLPQLRAARAALPHDDVLAEVEDDVRADVEAGLLYDHKDAAQVHPDGNERPLNHPVHGLGWASICAAEPLASPLARLMIIMYQPGERPHARLPHLRAAS